MLRTDLTLEAKEIYHESVGEDNEIEGVCATTFEEDDYGTLDAYDVRLDISYAETTIPTSALKTETVITIAKYPEGYFIVEIK